MTTADFVSVHAVLNDQTRHLIGEAELARLKPAAIFVNVSRGELSPSTALLAALDEELLDGVALDVYNHESELAVALRSKRPSNEPEVAATLALAARDDCLCTPHNAFNSAEGTRRKSEHSVRQILAFQETGCFLWPVPLE
jgi:phosphoglycerate dehydrogenase-like enzyme